VSAAFEYTATDGSGKRRRGSVRAADQAGAIRAVRALGLTPVRVGHGRERLVASGARGVSRRDVLQLTHELGTLLDAAVPIGEGLRAIAEQETGRSVRSMVLRIAQRIESGSTVTEALREHERAFGPVYLETIAAAERSGTMRSALGHLAEDLEWQLETGQRIHQSLMYPAAVATALVGGTSFLLAFVAPKFTAMFAERGVELPALTRGLAAAGAPPPAAVVDVIGQIEAENVAAVFGLEVFPSPVLEQIANETGATYVDDLRDDDLPGAPGDADHSWLGLMKFNFVTMTEALGGDASALADFEVRDVVPDNAEYPQ